MSSTLFRHLVLDDEARAVPGALVAFRQGRANGIVYTDPELKIPAQNPYPAKAGGRVVLYMPAGEQYDVTITTPSGQVLEQFVHTAIPSSGVQVIEREVPIEVERIVTVEDPETRAKLEEAETRLQSLKDELEAKKAPAPSTEPPPRIEPPAEIADLFDPNLTPRQNQEALQRKYSTAMSEYTRLFGYGDQASKAEALEHLRRAQRLDSGIRWNRPRAAEAL